MLYMTAGDCYCNDSSTSAKRHGYSRCFSFMLTPCQLTLPGRTLPPLLPSLSSSPVKTAGTLTPASDSAKEDSQDHSLKIVQDALELLTINKPVASSVVPTVLASPTSCQTTG